MDKQKKAIKNAIKAAERRALINNLPTTIEKIRALYKYLEKTLADSGCNHTHTLTIEWCSKNGIHNVVEWAEQHGGYCDCEVLMNMLEKVEEAALAEDMPLN